MEKKERYKKSENYKGVYQRKDGTWFYRYKRIFVKGEKPVYYQKSGFETEEQAYHAKQNQIRLEQFSVRGFSVDSNFQTFEEAFQDFLDNGCDSEISRKKYKALYDAQLSQWAERDINTIREAEIDNLLLGLALKKRKTKNENGNIIYKNVGYSESYHSSIRKLLKVFFYYAHSKNQTIPGDIAQNLGTKPYKLRVLSLFSGIGAPEQALKNMGVDFELVNFCEIDKKAARAYTLLHNIQQEKNLNDVTKIDSDYCKEKLPDFDLMVFGFPCQSVSSAGKREGLVEDQHPNYNNLFHNELGTLTESGLFYKALQIAIWKKPKFMLAENVENLIGPQFRQDFHSMVWNLQDAGYNVYFQKMNSKDFGVPQNRPRVFMVMVRDDLNMGFEFPEPRPLEVRAEDWFYETVIEREENEYYFTEKNAEIAERKIENGESYQANFKRDVISCLKTGSGQPYSGTEQTIVKDKKGIRCLCSEELMKFQGFPAEFGTILRDNGFSRNQVGKLVGNSITVPVLEAIFEKFVECLNKPLSIDIVPSKVIEAQTDEDFIMPIFPYAGNKSKLLKYLRYRFPSQDFLKEATFVDLFSGSAFMAINTPAKEVIINEINPFLVGIYDALSTIPPQEAWEMVLSVVKKYNLCPATAKTYNACRKDYNKIPYEIRTKEYWYWGLALVYHSFSSFSAHNSDDEFNSPVGKGRKITDNTKEKFFAFAEKLYKGNYKIQCQSYKEISLENLSSDQEYFFYADPPYLKTKASYNVYWKEEDEYNLYAFLDKLTDKGIKWMLSNVIENKKDKNEILIQWLKEHRSYQVCFMKRDYTYSTYKRKNKETEEFIQEEDMGKTVEVAVTNF